MPSTKLHVTEDNLREALFLTEALEGLIYHEGRSGAAALLAAARVFADLVIKTACGNPTHVFEDLYAYLCDPGVGLSADDPAMDTYVFPTHQTVQ
jgi:hypothetical protein